MGDILIFNHEMDLPSSWLLLLFLWLLVLLLLIIIINLKDSPTESFSDRGGLHIPTISQSTKAAEKRQGRKAERGKESRKGKR